MKENLKELVIDVQKKYEDLTWELSNKIWDFSEVGLIEYKSKKLLPREKVLIEEEFEEDQRDKLVARLLEYQRYKEVCQTFEDYYNQRQMSYTKPPSEETNQWITLVREEELQGNPYDLVKAMNKIIRRSFLQRPQQTRMTIKELSLDERVVQIQDRLRFWSGKMNFETLCEDCTDLHMVIVTFLSVLDLIKHGEINYAVDDDDTIWIIKGDE